MDDNDHDKAIFALCMEPGCTHIVKYLLERGCDCIEWTDLGKRTPLMVAAQHGCKETVELLLSRGVNPCRQSMPINDLILEVIDIPKIVKLLVKYIDVESLELLYTNIRRRFEQSHQHTGPQRAIVCSFNIIRKHVDSLRI